MLQLRQHRSGRPGTTPANTGAAGFSPHRAACIGLHPLAAHIGAAGFSPPLTPALALPYRISTPTLKNRLASFVGECHALSARFVLP